MNFSTVTFHTLVFLLGITLVYSGGCCEHKCRFNRRCRKTSYVQITPCSYSCTCDGKTTYYVEDSFTKCGTGKRCYQGDCLVEVPTRCQKKYGKNYIGLLNPINPCVYYCYSITSPCIQYEENYPTGAPCYTSSNKEGQCLKGRCAYGGIKHLCGKLPLDDSQVSDHDFIATSSIVSSDNAYESVFSESSSISRGTSSVLSGVRGDQETITATRIVKNPEIKGSSITVTGSRAGSHAMTHSEGNLNSGTVAAASSVVSAGSQSLSNSGKVISAAGSVVSSGSQSLSNSGSASAISSVGSAVSNTGKVISGSVASLGSQSLVNSGKDSVISSVVSSGSQSLSNSGSTSAISSSVGSSVSNSGKVISGSSVSLGSQSLVNSGKDSAMSSVVSSGSQSLINSGKDSVISSVVSSGSQSLVNSGKDSSVVSSVSSSGIASAVTGSIGSSESKYSSNSGSTQSVVAAASTSGGSFGSNSASNVVSASRAAGYDTASKSSGNYASKSAYDAASRSSGNYVSKSAYDAAKSSGNYASEYGSLSGYAEYDATKKESGNYAKYQSSSEIAEFEEAKKDSGNYAASKYQSSSGMAKYEAAGDTRESNFESRNWSSESSQSGASFQEELQQESSSSEGGSFSIGSDDANYWGTSRN